MNQPNFDVCCKSFPIKIKVANISYTAILAAIKSFTFFLFRILTMLKGKFDFLCKKVGYNPWLMKFHKKESMSDNKKYINFSKQIYCTFIKHPEVHVGKEEETL